MIKNDFSSNLLHWHKTVNNRKMPWKGEKNAYKIWLSEIILQQTKVEQGLKYYEKFILAFPTIRNLAKAKDDKVFKMWEGLGYYNRCKNLLFTARFIVENYDGIFPETYDAILQLKGIGKYTASAISSFAYNLPYAVVDGNVYRVLSRYLGNNTAIDSKEGVTFFEKKAQEFLDKENAAEYNQAIMDLGATVCKPKLAICDICPLQKKCKAYQQNKVYDFPVKHKKINVIQKDLLYFIFTKKDKVLVQQRTEKDIWQNLYEFVPYQLKQQTAITPKKVQIILSTHFHLKEFDIQFITKLYTQKLTHQIIKAHFIKINLNDYVEEKKQLWVTQNQLKKLPFAAIINDFLKNDKNHIIFDK